MLEQASAEDANDVLVQGSFRVCPEIKSRAEAVCKARGTSLSTFLRKCCENLVNEWGSCDALE